MNELSEGAKVLACWSSGGIEKKWMAEDHDSMIISMQPGNGAMVPWVRIRAKGGTGKIVLINCASLEGVSIATKES